MVTVMLKQKLDTDSSVADWLMLGKPDIELMEL